MKLQVKDLIAAIISKSADAGTHFESALSNKIGSLFEQRRAVVAAALLESGDEPSSASAVKSWASNKAKEDMQKNRQKTAATLSAVKKEMDDSSESDKAKRKVSGKVLNHLFAKTKRA